MTRVTTWKSKSSVSVSLFTVTVFLLSNILQISSHVINVPQEVDPELKGEIPVTLTILGGSTVVDKDTESQLGVESNAEPEPEPGHGIEGHIHNSNKTNTTDSTATKNTRLVFSLDFNMTENSRFPSFTVSVLHSIPPSPSPSGVEAVVVAAPADPESLVETKTGDKSPAPPRPPGPKATFTLTLRDDKSDDQQDNISTNNDVSENTDIESAPNNEDKTIAESETNENSSNLKASSTLTGANVIGNYSLLFGLAGNELNLKPIYSPGKTPSSPIPASVISQTVITHNETEIQVEQNPITNEIQKHIITNSETVTVEGKPQFSGTNKSESESEIPQGDIESPINANFNQIVSKTEHVVVDVSPQQSESEADNQNANQILSKTETVTLTLPPLPQASASGNGNKSEDGIEAIVNQISTNPVVMTIAETITVEDQAGSTDEQSENASQLVTKTETVTLELQPEGLTANQNQSEAADTENINKIVIKAQNVTSELDDVENANQIITKTEIVTLELLPESKAESGTGTGSDLNQTSNSILIKAQNVTTIEEHKSDDQSAGANQAVSETNQNANNPIISKTETLTLELQPEPESESEPESTILQNNQNTNKILKETKTVIVDVQPQFTDGNKSEGDIENNQNSNAFITASEHPQLYSENAEPGLENNNQIVSKTETVTMEVVPQSGSDPDKSQDAEKKQVVKKIETVTVYLQPQTESAGDKSQADLGNNENINNQLITKTETVTTVVDQPQLNIGDSETNTYYSSVVKMTGGGALELEANNDNSNKKTSNINFSNNNFADDLEDFKDEHIVRLPPVALHDYINHHGHKNPHHVEDNVHSHPQPKTQSGSSSSEVNSGVDLAGAGKEMKVITATVNFMPLSQLALSESESKSEAESDKPVPFIPSMSGAFGDAREKPEVLLSELISATGNLTTKKHSIKKDQESEESSEESSEEESEQHRGKSNQNKNNNKQTEAEADAQDGNNGNGIGDSADDGNIDTDDLAKFINLNVRTKVNVTQDSKSYTVGHGPYGFYRQPINRPGAVTMVGPGAGVAAGASSNSGSGTGTDGDNAPPEEIIMNLY